MKIALRAVFYLGLVLLLLFMLLLVAQTAFGKSSGTTAEPGSISKHEKSPYERAAQVVRLSLSNCWNELGENPFPVRTDVGVAARTEVTVQEYIDCVIYQLKGWSLMEQKSGTDSQNGADAENEN
jgi:hypothetical protein